MLKKTKILGIISATIGVIIFAYELIVGWGNESYSRHPLISLAFSTLGIVLIAYSMNKKDKG
ncbi:MAG: hypothetical protein NTX97_00550 [Bacteroidetes bacterium]|nr:hypothetical protein [Bacteroidota bacterium]